MSFQGTVTPPPAMASPGMAAFASLFDKVCVICYQSTCNGQKDAWPSSIQSKLVVLDSYKVNVDLGIKDVDDHGYQVTQGHAAAWDLLNEPDVNSVLIFEDDWTPNNSTVAAFEDAATLAGMQKFVSTESWGMLRVGYNPLETVTPRNCPSNCKCTTATETDRVCAVTLSENVSSPHCDIRSFVSYAVHQSLYPELSAYAHASFDNLTMYKGLLAETRKDYTGPKNAQGFVSSPQDIYMPSTIDVIHYMTPGFMTQHDKPEQALPMAEFGVECNPASPAPSVGSLIGTLSGGTAPKASKRASSSILFSDHFRQALQPK